MAKLIVFIITRNDSSICSISHRNQTKNERTIADADANHESVLPIYVVCLLYFYCHDFICNNDFVNN